MQTKKTADLVVRHVEAHLIGNRISFAPAKMAQAAKDDYTGVFLFAVSGLVISLFAWQMIGLTLAPESSAIVAYELFDQNFFGLHGSAPALDAVSVASARETLHAAAEAKNLARYFNFAGLIVLGITLLFLGYLENPVTLFRPKFRITKIK